MRQIIFSSALVSAISIAAIATAEEPSLNRRAAAAITVSPDQKFQIVHGFGMSETFQRANQLHAMSTENQRLGLDLLFSMTKGAGFSILRNGIGSSPDSSSDHMVSIQPKSPGGPDATPKYVWDGNDNSQVWVSQEAVKYGVKTIYADAWSAPGYMKTNGNDANGGTLCGVSGSKCSSGDWKQAYADYLVQYLKYYREVGVNITYVGFLNEPELTTSYASMRSSGTQAADFIKVLHPTLKKAGMEQIGIACCDTEGWNDQNGMSQQMTAAGVDSMISITTAHAYTSSPGSPLRTTHPVWQTEWADLQGAWTSAWYSNNGAGEGMNWAQKIQSAMTGANCSAFLYWVGIQKGDTNSKLIRIDGNKITPSKRLWAFGQFSRYVRPGAVRIGVSGSGLRLSAFKNEDGRIAIQAINTGTSAQDVTITVKGVKATKVEAFLTDNTHDIDSTPAQVAADGTVTGSVPARAFVSFVISSGASNSTRIGKAPRSVVRHPH